MTNQIEWHKIDSVEDLPKESGYFLINLYSKSEHEYGKSLNEDDYKIYCQDGRGEDIWNNVERAYYSAFTKLWNCSGYTRNAINQYVDQDVESIVTHWAEMPKTPNVVQQEPEHEQPKRGFLGMKWGYNN